jgi:predicted aconitase
MQTPAKPTAVEGISGNRQEQSAVAVSRARQGARRDRENRFKLKCAAITGKKR